MTHPDPAQWTQMGRLREEVTALRRENRVLADEVERLRTSRSFRLAHVAAKGLDVRGTIRRRRREAEAQRAIPTAARAEDVHELVQPVPAAESVQEPLDEAYFDDLAARTSDILPLPRAGSSHSRGVTSGSRALEVTTGTGLEDVITPSARTLLYVVLGGTEEEVESVIREVAKVQFARRDFKPLFLTDSTAIHLFRRRDYVVEHLPADSWDTSLLERRAERIIQTYKPDGVIVYETPRQAPLLGIDLLDWLMPADDDGDR